MSDDDLPDWVLPGASYRLHGRRFHVRGIVDGRVVVKEWWSSKQRWNYAVEPAFIFAYPEFAKHIIIVKRGLRNV